MLESGGKDALIISRGSRGTGPGARSSVAGGCYQFVITEVKVGIGFVVGVLGGAAAGILGRIHRLNQPVPV